MKQIINWSYKEKVVLFSIIISSTLFIFQLTTSYLDFRSLQKINGEIKEIKLEPGKKTYVTVLLKQDTKRYFQKYSYRFFDSEILQLRQNQSIYFFTTKLPKYANGPLIGNYGQKGFYYYPIFNINDDKNYFSVFLQKFYEVSLLNIIMLTSIAASSFYSIFFLASTSWRNRILPICLMIVLFWLLH